MPLTEATVQNHIRDMSAQLGHYLWRNNVGVLPNPETNQPVRYGLLNDSPKLNKIIKSSDLVGPTSIMITPDMVGRMVAVFTAVEVKKEDWKYNPKSNHEVAQQAFIDLVRSAGGLAGFATSTEDYKRIITL